MVDVFFFHHGTTTGHRAIVELIRGERGNILFWAK
jgi:hypothetical protein